MAEVGEPVTLYVYDLSQGMARQLSASFLGVVIDAIYHTSIVVFGKEFSFGQGIDCNTPGRTPHGRPIQQLPLGKTEIPAEIFQEYLQDIAPRFTPDRYSLMSFNCNNFSDELANFLVGTGIPQHILDLPKVVMNSPMGPMLMPLLAQMEGSLRNGSVPEAPTPTSLVSTLVPAVRYPSGVQISEATTSISERTAGRQVEVTTSTISRSQAGAPGEFMQQTNSSVTVDVNYPEEGAKESIQESCHVKRAETSEAHKGPSKGGEGATAEEARRRMKEEIEREFSELMASGNLVASEAAALALKRVHGRIASSRR